MTGRYVNSIEQILKLGWLPMRERRDWHVLKAAHKALHSSDWPPYFGLEKSKHTRVLRSNAEVNLVIPLISNTFQDCSAALFNPLPADIKSCTDFRSFSRQTFDILKQRISS